MTAERATSSRRKGRRRHPWLRAANIALTIVFAVVWWNLYRPQFVGGPAGYARVEGASMWPSFREGDFVITREHAHYHVGEVVAYRVPAGSSGSGLHVIHRIVGGSAAQGYVTKGDNRLSVDPWRPKPADIIGSVAVHVPYAGWVIGVLQEPPVFAWFVGSIVLVGVWMLDRRRREALQGVP
jgi:signal peptidase